MNISQEEMRKKLMRQSPFARLGARLHTAVRADAPQPLRYDWGGHDPATPMAEMQYNYYHTAWAVVMFVAVKTLMMFMK
jgi:hypothetical protein